MPDFSLNFAGPIVKLRGRNHAVPVTEALLNAYTSSTVRWPSVFDAAYQLDISSSSAADLAATGTGARTLDIYGLDKDFNPLKETISLNGQTKITTVNAFRRVFEAVIVSAGTGFSAAGDIYLVKTGTGGTYTAGVPGTLTGAVLKILATGLFGLSGLWTAPRGTCYSLAAFGVSARAQSGTIYVNHAFRDNELVYPQLKIDVTPANPIFAPTGAPIIVVNEKEDIYLSALAATAGGIFGFDAVFIQQGIGY
jgi:hypothetical protein